MEAEVDRCCQARLQDGINTQEPAVQRYPIGAHTGITRSLPGGIKHFTTESGKTRGMSRFFFEVRRTALAGQQLFPQCIQVGIDALISILLQADPAFLREVFRFVGRVSRAETGQFSNGLGFF